MPEERLRRRRAACPLMTPLPLGVQVERGILVRSSHARREENMWGFAQAALDLLAECVAEAQAARTASSSAATAAAAAPPPPPPPPLLSVREDRYGGVEVSVREGGELELSAFVAELHAALERWHAAGKRGVWLRLSSRAHGLVSAAVSAGFEYHHATPHHLQLTRWLPQGEPSPLPRYALAQIGHSPTTRQSLPPLVPPYAPMHMHMACMHMDVRLCQVRLHADRRGRRRARCAGPRAHGAGLRMRSTCRAHVRCIRGASVQVCSCAAYDTRCRNGSPPRRACKARGSSPAASPSQASSLPQPDPDSSPNHTSALPPTP